ncbi:MAG: hypothetical protein IH939_13360 [Acidobacteria bacterium]|nr:hypothetical protein [Acidobacteriota bacterium]
MRSFVLITDIAGVVQSFFDRRQISQYPVLVRDGVFLVAVEETSGGVVGGRFGGFDQRPNAWEFLEARREPVELLSNVGLPPNKRLELLLRQVVLLGLFANFLLRSGEFANTLEQRLPASADEPLRLLNLFQ